ncbi:gpmA [Symbiodinium natans]|uniref:GpmA protein n=1 Tax=Symbiodinium natans TaxID=878477 RepID=A0A812QSR6_9DINO|nr:gpmA [Symbiodinium natans]
MAAVPSATAVVGPGPLPQSPVATSWGWKPATQVEDRRFGPVKSEPLVRKDCVPFVCRDGLPLDYGAVADDVWKDFDVSLSKLANEAAFLRGMLKALGREGKGRGDVPRLPSSKLLPMPVCKDMVMEEKTKLIEPGTGGLQPSRLRENRSPRSVRLGKVVVQKYPTGPTNKEIIEDGSAPLPEKEAPVRVRRPFGEVNLSMNSAPFRVRATVG